MDHQSCPLVASNTMLLKSGQYSDLTVRCGGNEYHLHRAIVCPRSDFLTIACDGRFREGATGVIDLPDDDPATFASLVEHLYTLQYNDDSAEKGEDSDALTEASANALVYAMADKYNVADLAVIAEAKFRPIISKLSDEDLPAALEIIVTTTPPSCKGLRSLILTECVKRMPTLVKNEAFICVLSDHAEVGSALALEGYETMRAEVDKVEHQLGEARKTMTSQQDELKIAKERIEDLEGELRVANRRISYHNGGSSPARSLGFGTIAEARA